MMMIMLKSIRTARLTGILWKAGCGFRESRSWESRWRRWKSPRSSGSRKRGRSGAGISWTRRKRRGLREWHRRRVVRVTTSFRRLGRQIRVAPRARWQITDNVGYRHAEHGQLQVGSFLLERNRLASNFGSDVEYQIIEYHARIVPARKPTFVAYQYKCESRRDSYYKHVILINQVAFSLYFSFSRLYENRG